MYWKLGSFYCANRNWTL